MQNPIHKAQKGSQEAMFSLYGAHKHTVLSLCNMLLLDENEADHATALVFKTVFEELAAGRIVGKEEFTRLTIRKTVMHCKALTTKKSSRAFRVPVNSNFELIACDPAKIDLFGTEQQILLKNLPAFHRYIYVLHTVCDYSPEQISRIFATTVRVIENALEAEPLNVDKIVAAARRKRSSLPEYTTQDFHNALVTAAADAAVPAAVDAAVKLHVQSVCTPILKQQRKKGNILLGITGMIAVFLVVLLVAFSTMGDVEDSDVDLNNTDPDFTESTNAATEATDPAAEELTITHYADIEIEGYGTITVALYADAAPETVANFVSLAKSGFYDGLTFHRIIDGFMMQGGDPNGDSTGGNTDEDGNKITITGEFSLNGFNNPLSHTAGAISMARGSDYDSASSQFFIVHTDDNTGSLDGYYACFGYVTDGMDIVDAICAAADPDAENGIQDAEDQPIITSITIREAEDTENTDSTDSTDATDSTDGTNATDSTEGTEDSDE